MQQLISQIEVSVWGMPVGTVTLDKQTGFYSFMYYPAFTRKNIQLAPLTLPAIPDIAYTFSDLPEATYKRLPALLSDALPDDFGNSLIDNYLAGKGIAKSAISALDRLAYMGDRSMGALTFKPVRGPTNTTAIAMDMQTLVNEARAAVQGPLSSDSTAIKTLTHLIEVGTSAGGARAKAVVAIDPVTQELRSGQSQVPANFEHWLLKFDGLADKSLGSATAFGRIEYAYYLMARHCGITISESRLLEENGRAHFMTRRFDRGPNGLRHHVQTLCAMAHMDYKKLSAHSYAQLFQTATALHLDAASQQEIFRRMVFNVFSKNCDDHPKNFAFILQHPATTPEACYTWQLAPAYDLTFSYKPNSYWVSQHFLSVNGQFKNISRIDCMRVADQFGIANASAILEEVLSGIAKWPSFAQEAGVPDGEWQAIWNHLQHTAAPTLNLG